MRRINNVTANGIDYTLLVEFENSIVKFFDCKPLLSLSAFQPLADKHVFTSIQNKGYFVEWPTHEIDLSADTLWHDGTPTTVTMSS